MALTAITVQARIVKNGGPITSEVWKGDGTNTHVKGQLLKAANGTVTPVLVLGSSPATLDTDDTGTANIKLFIALSDVSVATSAFVPVQEIKSDTIFQVRLVASSSGSPVAATALKGDVYALYQLASGVWGIDVDNSTKPVVQVVDIEQDFDPYDKDNGENYGRVWVKVLSAILA